MMKKDKEKDRQDAIASLRKNFGVKLGATIYSIVTRVSPSGMSRRIWFFVSSHGRVMDISWPIARATGFRFDSRSGGVFVNGCGMDMCFHVVYTLGRVMFPKGGPLSKSPREHQEKRLGKTRETDGGYLLRSEIL